jgi:hypothetical protein
MTLPSTAWYESLEALEPADLVFTDMTEDDSWSVNPEDYQTIEQAICRLQADGYRLEACSDGVTRYIQHHPHQAIEACSGTEQAVFFFEKPGHHCTLFVVWGLGEDCIADFSADCQAELDRIDDLIYA